MKLTIEQALQKGIAAHKEGKTQQAESFYRAILKSQPLHPDANHNLGLLEVSFNKVKTALPLFKKAIDSNSKIEQFWLSYIDTLIKDKQFDNAKKVLEQAKNHGVDGNSLNSLAEILIQLTNTPKSKLSLQKKSKSFSEKRKKLTKQKKIKKSAIKRVKKGIASPPKKILNNLLELYQSGRFNDAEKLALDITKDFPKHKFSWFVLGAVLGATGRSLKALTANQVVVKLSPQDAAAHINLGVTLHELGKLDEAVASYNQAIVLNPDYAEAHNNLGNTLKELERLDEAVSSYNQAIVLNPDYAEAYSNLGIIYSELGRLDEAKDNLKKATTLKPDLAEAHNNFGTIFKVQGKLEKAEASYKKAIAINPDYAEAHRNLTTIKKFVSQDGQFSKMLELYLDENISQDKRCNINFGLAKVYEDLGDFEKAFIHYSEGNALRKKLLKYNINQDLELFRQIKAYYPQIENISIASNKLLKNLTPIFIVGMPRSGTTLVEQIISSHSKVTGAGELKFVGQFGTAIATGFSKANNESLLNFRSKYLRKLETISDGNMIITDKMPQNFLYLGLIAAVFNEAKIIHVKRNPAALCWANFKQYFISKNIGYCYAIDDIINYYKMYENLMNFWINKLSKKIYKVDYEQLTVNQESETRKLIDYLDLNWDEKCLSPENNARSVTSASNVQVRKKVYRGSSEQWRKYQPFLNGAFDDLMLK